MPKRKLACLIVYHVFYCMQKADYEFRCRPVDLVSYTPWRATLSVLGPL